MSGPFFAGGGGGNSSAVGRGGAGGNSAYSVGGLVVSFDRARAVAEWLAAEQKHLGQRTANMILNFWLDDVERMKATAAWLLAEAHWERRTVVDAVAAAAADRNKITETRLRDAQNALEVVRARVSHAARVGLLTHRGEWPAEVIDATALAMQGLPSDSPFEVGGHARWVAARVLDAAARAIHHDHVHVAAPVRDQGWLPDLHGNPIVGCWSDDVAPTGGES